MCVFVLCMNNSAANDLMLHQLQDAPAFSFRQQCTNNSPGPLAPSCYCDSRISNINNQIKDQNLFLSQKRLKEKKQGLTLDK